MLSNLSAMVLAIFSLTVLFIIWRPRGMNEAIPTTIGACLVMLIGVVPISDLYKILEIVGGAAITILSTIVMSIVLESVGFFRWVAYNLIEKAQGSGTKLFFSVILLCFLMTLFFNNDGSILITTPIIIDIVNRLGLKVHQKIPYLLGGALVATAASAPIGVSNLANLISLKIVGLDLNSYAQLMFVPSMFGIATITLLLFWYYRNSIPQRIPQLASFTPHRLDNFNHPLAAPVAEDAEIDWGMFKICISIVILTRASFFVLTTVGVPLEGIAIVGAVLLILVRWYRQGIGPKDILEKTPWHIILFAFGMYIIIYGLHNAGFTNLLINGLKSIVSTYLLSTILSVGILVTFLSNICNNLPAVMIATLALTQMGLTGETLQVAYLASVIGSDVGALLTPMGTLATLIWMFLLRSKQIKITWGQYMRVTLMVIPGGLLVSLLFLYFWTTMLFK